MAVHGAINGGARHHSDGFPASGRANSEPSTDSLWAPGLRKGRGGTTWRSRQNAVGNGDGGWVRCTPDLGFPTARRFEERYVDSYQTGPGLPERVHRRFAFALALHSDWACSARRPYAKSRRTVACSNRRRSPASVGSPGTWRRSPAATPMPVVVWRGGNGRRTQQRAAMVSSRRVISIRGCTIRARQQIVVQPPV